MILSLEKDNQMERIERMKREDEENEMDDKMAEQEQFQGNKKNVYIFAKKDPHRYMENRNI